MTAHAPAIPRRRIDIGAWLRARHKPKDEPPDDFRPLHMHDWPTLILRTTQGDHQAQFTSACMYEDALALHYWFVPKADMTVFSIIYRFGKDESVLAVHETTELKFQRGAAVKMDLALPFDVEQGIANFSVVP